MADSKSKAANAGQKGIDYPDLLGSEDGEMTLALFRLIIKAVRLGHYVQIGTTMAKDSLLLSVKGDTIRPARGGFTNSAEVTAAIYDVELALHIL